MINNQDYISAVNAPVREMTASVTIDNITYSGDGLPSVCVYFNGKLLRTVMRCAEITISGLIKDYAVTLKGKSVDSLQIGARSVGGEYAYIDYGEFIVYKVDYLEESGVTVLTCYDKMLESMKKNTLTVTGNTITGNALLNKALTALGWTLASEDYSSVYNLSANISTSNIVYAESATWRDILDNIAEFLGVSMCFKPDGKLYLILPYGERTPVVLSADKVKSSLMIGEEAGYVTKLNVTSAGQTLYTETTGTVDDEERVYTAEDNPLFNDVNTVGDMLEELYNTSYHIFDGDYFGFGYIEFGDALSIQDKDGAYKESICLSSTFYVSADRVDEHLKADVFYGDEDYSTTNGIEKQINNIVNNYKVLWSGAKYMGETTSGIQEISLTEPISKQQTGVILVFSAYVNGAAQDYQFQSYLVHKLLVATKPNAGHNFPLSTTEFGFIGNKYLYIRDNKIIGNASNSTSGDNNGVHYDNRHWVLRYVLGV